MSVLLSRASRALPWMAALALLAVVLGAVSLREAAIFLSRLDAAAIVVLLAANGLVLLVLSGRWWVLLRGQGHAIPYLTLAGYRLAAFGVTYLTPGPQFGGEPLQVYLPEKLHGVPRHSAIMAVTLDKSLELLVNFGILLAAVALAIDSGVISGHLREEAVGLSLALLALPVAFLAALWFGRSPLSALLSPVSRLPLPPRWQQAAVSLQHSLRDGEAQAGTLLRGHPRTRVAALVVSLLAWAGMLAEYWLALHLLGLELTPVQALALMMAGRLAYLAALPAGLGALEASQVLMLGAMGVDPAAGISISLLIRARDLLVALVGLWWGARLIRRARLHPVPAFPQDRLPAVPVTSHLPSEGDPP